ncbi:MAG: hypothetical protein KBS82_05310 [Oscillospiraceae bacterium]|nr:hypothetical protein [Candidatus Limimonas egerieequi]
MNDKKRRDLKEAYSHLEIAYGLASKVLDQEQDSLDNVPESFRDTDKYEEMEDKFDSLDEVVQMIDDSMGLLEEIM